MNNDKIILDLVAQLFGQLGAASEQLAQAQARIKELETANNERNAA